MLEHYSSELLEHAVSALGELPGIGRKTALRLALHLLKRETHEVEAFARALVRFRNDIKKCKLCHSLSDTETCEICSNPKRNSRQLCVVENVRDVMAVESTQQFSGLYHVLGGLISPIDGIGPKDLEIESLIERVSSGNIEEVILALSPTMEGDTTAFYIARRLEGQPVELTTIARGVAAGDELEYADEVALGRSLAGRTAFKTNSI